jgi:hypothetical protein
MNSPLVFKDARDIEDLRSFLTRAKKLDSDGVVRFRAFGDVLAVYVSPIYSGSLMADGPTVIGLRTIPLSNPSETDSVVPIDSVLERLPRTGEANYVELPEVRALAAWTGVTPPRAGWELVGEISESQLTQWAKDGIKEVAETLPESVGSSIAAKVRLGIWGRTISLEFNLPAGSAFVAAGLGFLTRDEQVKVFRAHGWVRLSSTFGHVLAKESFRLA